MNEKGKEKDNRGFSLVVKLNTRLLWRLFGVYLILDILFVLLMGIFFIYKAESSFDEIYSSEQPAISELKKEETMEIHGGYHVSVIQTIPKNSYLLPKAFLYGDTSSLENKPRYFVAEKKNGFFQTVTNVTYGVYDKTENQNYTAIVYDIGNDFRILAVILAVILVVEGLIFLNHISSGARIIRSSLKPIYEIEMAARSLKSTTSLAELSVLAGRIKSIEAKNLSSRISVDSAQEELKGLSDAINDLLERIEEAYRSQSRFVSDASHELRTPISVIQGYVNLLDRWGKNDEKTTQESIDAIKKEADNMKDLIEQLLFLARGDNEAMALHLENFNISLLVEEIYQESQMIDPNHTIVFYKEPSMYVNGDIQFIKQALRIFIDNSIKYTPPGEKITVKVAKEDDTVKITVQDNGIGIVTEDLPYIFDRFYRSDDSRARKTGGTGLGLSIAKWIVHRHGGFIEVLSRKDFGTRTMIILPLSKETEEDKNRTL